MRRSLHTDEEIAFLLGEAERGTPIAAICTSARVSLGTFYRWRRRLGGLRPPGVARLGAVEAENAALRAEVQRLRAALTVRPNRADREAPACAPAVLRPSPRYRGAEACVGRFAFVRSANCGRAAAPASRIPGVGGRGSPPPTFTTAWRAPPSASACGRPCCRPPSG